MIRLIASDLDGTLLSSGDTIHPDNAAILREVMDRGVRFTIASGRIAPSCSLLLRENGMEDAAIIAMNGCQVVERAFGRVLANHYMDREAALEILRILQEAGLDAFFCGSASLVYSNAGALDGSTGEDWRAQHAVSMRRLGVEVDAGWDAIRRLIDEGPMKAVCSFQLGEEARFAQAREACARVGGIELTSSWHNNFEVMPRGVDKGTALKFLADTYGIDRGEVLAFGDNDNDLPMLRWAGHAYAMDNALDAVKEAVSNVTGACHEGGVAQAIRALC